MGLQGATRDYEELLRVKRGLQVVTRLQGVYRGLQEVTGGYKGLRGVTGGYRGYKGL